jgi:hypothetical protein
MTAPNGFVPDSSENLAEDPLSDGDATPVAMEKTAAGAPAQERTQVCHPVSFCMSGITWALVGAPLVGVGLAPGAGFDASGVGPDDAVADFPPHPASATQAARVKTTRLGRSSFFTSFILGNSLRVAGFRR